VVGEDNTAKQKYVTLGQLAGNLRIIKDGLAADDKVVVNGLARIRPNIEVKPQEQDAKPTDTAPQAKN
jgi:multidrug efflux system membrane fusion protein